MTAIFMLLAKVVGTQGYSVALAMAALSAWLLTFFEMRTWNKSIGVLIICVSPSPPFVAPPPQSGVASGMRPRSVVMSAKICRFLVLVSVP